MTPVSRQWISSAVRLSAQGRPFALVSVVRAQAPTSARAGDKAVVTADGRIEGWIGGGCAQPAVLRTVRRSLQDGQARMIRIAAATEGHERDLGDLLEFGMACHSGGTLELFVDPVLPPASLVVVGDSPVALSLADLAPRVGLSVTVVAHQADAAAFANELQVLASDDPAVVAAVVPPGAWVVVATQGRRDLQGLRLALALTARTVFFVASARKAAVLRGSLLASGCDAAAVAAIVAPAGDAIGAQTPQEIALSVLAAVVSARRPEIAGERVSLQPAVALRTAAASLPDAPEPARSCCGGATAAAST